MIPKIIHWCWFSKEIPNHIIEFVNGWKLKHPDFIIKKWDYSNFDINQSIWVKEALEAKKFAFVADYIRCYSLYNEGGIYLDSDVESIKSFNNLLDKPYFIGKDQRANGTSFIEAAVMGFEPNHPLFKMMLDYYNNRHFKTENGYDIRVIPDIILELAKDNFQIKFIRSPEEISNNLNELDILPAKYFSPKQCDTGKLYITEETYCIHHYDASWIPTKQKRKRKLKFFIIKHFPIVYSFLKKQNK